MEKSTHKCEVVEVFPQPHPNADRLEVAQVYGYSVCIGKGDFTPGSLGIYIPPDSIVPQVDAFRFVWESKGYVPDASPSQGTNDIPVVPEKYRRIKAKVLRGVPSEGLLMPLGAFPELGPGPKPNGWEVGDDVADKLHITHYEAPDPSSLAGDCEVAPDKPEKKKRGYPKTLRGWVRFLLSKIAFWRKPVETTEALVSHRPIPAYDIDAWQRYRNLLQPGEQIWVTEKIHGANSRFVWMNDRLYCGSHYQWKKNVPGSAWWDCVKQNPWIEDFCKKNPGYVLYGELVPTQKLKYGQQPGKYRLFAFDVLDTRDIEFQPRNRWLSRQDLANLSWRFSYMEGDNLVERSILDEVHWVPTIALCSYDPESVRKLADGDSLVAWAKHIREGCVIKPLEERVDVRFGRVILKIVSPAYLGSKQSE